MIRIGVFSLLYSVPASFVVGCFWYEYEILKDVEKNSANMLYCQLDPYCRKAQTPTSAVTYMKYFMLLVVGVTSGVWIWSSKTVESWRKFYYKCCGKGYDLQLKPAKKTEMNANRPQVNQPQDPMQNLQQFVQRQDNMYSVRPPMTMGTAIGHPQYVSTQHNVVPAQYINTMNTQSMGPMVATQMSPMPMQQTMQQTVPFYTMPVMAHSLVSQPNSIPLKVIPKNMNSRGSTSASHCTSIRTSGSENYASGGSRI